MYNKRLLPWFRQNIAEAIFLKKKPNVRWASGFQGADSYVLMTPDDGFLLTDPRYTEQASGGSVMKAVAHILKEQKLHSLAFESDALSYNEYSALQRETDAELVPVQDVVEKLRSVKTPQEMEYIRAACDISCRAFYRIIKDIRVGVTEKELAARLSS